MRPVVEAILVRSNNVVIVGQVVVVILVSLVLVAEVVAVVHMRIFAISTISNKRSSRFLCDFRDEDIESKEAYAADISHLYSI